MSLKLEFVERASKPGARIAPLCRQYGISRETGYKWLGRFKRDGYAGLDEESRRPKSSPLATAEELVMAILQAREAHPAWGPKKVRHLLTPKFKDQTPSLSTVVRVLKRFGLVRRRRKTPQRSVVERAPNVPVKAPNELWTVDFKGWWRTLDRRRCEPLTVRDAFSRYVLAMHVMRHGPDLEEVKAIFVALFRKHGLPAAIQCDNGVPFINTRARGGLTRLSVWWISLGIRVVRSRLGCPQDNGAHERMHRDVAEQLQAYPAESRAAEQRACGRWRQEFNHVRPHEALGGKVPAELYRTSERRALRPSAWLYPPGWTVRFASTTGIISIEDQKYTTTRALAGERVALEPLGDLRYRLWFRNVDLGELVLAPSNEVIDEMSERALNKLRKKVA
jgi:putative transposase